jgi:hypothetical protein
MRNVAFALVLVAGCATSGEQDFDLDRQAAEEVAATGGKADGISFERLERATADEVAASFQDVRGTQIADCFAVYTAEIDPDATTLSAEVAGEFLHVSDLGEGNVCEDWSELEETVNGVLAQLGVAEAPIGDVIDALDDYAVAQLADAKTDGFVDLAKAAPLFHDDIVRVQDANAIAREQDPTDVDLTEIRAAWDQVRINEQETLDGSYLNPIVFPKTVLDGSDLDIFKGLRSAFPLEGLKLIATSRRAINGFWQNNDGPDDDPDFEPIAITLEKTSIVKRFYFRGDRNNMLLVVDDQNQAWGLQMGYSE